MKPWQIMCLVAISLGVVTWYIGTLIPEGFFLAIGMASAVVLIATKVMRPGREG